VVQQRLVLDREERERLGVERGGAELEPSERVLHVGVRICAHAEPFLPAGLVVAGRVLRPARRDDSIDGVPDRPVGSKPECLGNEEVGDSGPEVVMFGTRLSAAADDGITPDGMPLRVRRSTDLLRHPSSYLQGARRRHQDAEVP
jgi:hypothetical protein